MTVDPPAPAPLISVDRLVFDYDTTRALSDISFTIEPGMVVALVGPNGAGKTTLMRCISALEQPTAGDVHVDGLEVREDPRTIHRKIGFLPDFFGLYDELTVRQALAYHAAAKKIAPEDRAARVGWVAEMLGVDAMFDRRVGELSRGNRQKLAIAQSVIHRPLVALLDEPASGLDPDARRRLSETILALNDEGMTLIVSSHILSELEDYSTHVLVMRGGKLEAFRDLRQAAGGGPERITLRVRLSTPDVRLGEILRGVQGADVLDAGDRDATFVFPGDASAQHDCLKHLIDSGLTVSEMAPTAQSMSDVYFDSGNGAGETRS
ncbi:MAG: ATP-binding cassette domain-containing protein [Alphaproteobacteria bacterium]|nr:ATP-binding cassette domain-containing protein [Alphaproteobacteria bacterium]